MRLRRSFQLVVFAIALSTMVASDAVGQVTFPAAPPAGRSVSDSANLVNAADAAAIDRMAAAIRSEKGYPIGVVTIRSLAAQGAAGYTIERYAAELMKAWRPDEPFATHGMLLLVAADNKAARVQLGSAWGNTHDERSRKLMDKLVLPSFKKNEFSAGILNGVRGFDAMSRQLQFPLLGKPSWVPDAMIVDGFEDPWWTLPALVVVGIVIVVGLVAVAKSGRQSWAWAAGAFIVALVLARVFGRKAEAADGEGGATGSWATDDE
jgi:uncharacterized protein